MENKNSIYKKAQECVEQRRMPYKVEQFINRIFKKKIKFYWNGKRKTLKLDDKMEDAGYKMALFEILDNNVYCPRIRENMDFKIREDDTVIDIGAGKGGLFALYAANLAKNGKVYGFEPCKENFQKVVYHKKMNKMDNLVLVNKAISDKTEQAKLYFSNICVRHSLYKEMAEGGDGRYTLIDCVSLKEAFDQYEIKKCNFLKIDCEGAEYKILFGTPPEYFERIEKIALEYHKNGDVLELAKFLNRYGYVITIEGYPSDRGMLFAFKYV